MIRIVALLSLCACAAVPDITYVDGGDNTCPGSVPSYADICCGSVPCKGLNCLAACAACESNCHDTTVLCCPNAAASAVCRPNLQCK